MENGINKKNIVDLYIKESNIYLHTSGIDIRMNRQNLLKIMSLAYIRWLDENGNILLSEPNKTEKFLKVTLAIQNTLNSREELMNSNEGVITLESTNENGLILYKRK